MQWFDSTFRHHKNMKNKETEKINKYTLIWAKKLYAIRMLGSKCSCCGEERPWALCFHHKDPSKKEILISTATRHLSLDGVIREASKCVLLCQNCHMAIHGQNRQYKEIALLANGNKRCVRCGRQYDYRCLNFHHKGNKEKGSLISYKSFVSRRRWLDVCDIDKQLLKEIRSCDVLCRNCHSEIHFDIHKFDSLKSVILSKLNTFTKEHQNGRNG